MKNKVCAALLVGLIMPGASFAGNYMGCEVFVNRAVTAQQELNDFYNLFVRPVEKQAVEVKSQLNFKINRPKEIVQKLKVITKESQDLQAEISNLNSNIALNTSQAEALQVKASEADAKGDVKEAKKLRAQIKNLQDTILEQQKKVAKRSARIEFLADRVTTLNEEKEKIENEAPTIAELQSNLEKLNLQLADQNKMKTQKADDVRIFVEGSSHCLSYQSLSDSVLSIRNSGCSVMLPYPKSEAETRGQQDARRAMGCY